MSGENKSAESLDKAGSLGHSSSTLRWTCQNLHKRFAAPVLQGIDLSLHSGSVLALLGANGAGKSTLGKIIAGLLHPDQGSMTLDSRPFAPRNKRHAESLGVHIVLQELNVFPTLSVAENLYLGRFPHQVGWIRRNELKRLARAALDRVGLHELDVDQTVDRLGVGERQLLEIARALSQQCRLLVLDEPTAALTQPQVERLFAQLQQLRREGVAMIYVSHRLDEIQQVADQIAIMRDGRFIEQGATTDFDVERAVVAMSGVQDRPISRSHQAERIDASIGSQRGKTPLLHVSGLSSGPRVRRVDLEVWPGEIVGLAGLVGAGRSETLRLIVGADRAKRGRVMVNQRRSDAPFLSAREAIAAGIALVPEDRKLDGLLLGQSVTINTTLGSIRQFIGRFGLINSGREQASAIDSLAPFDTRFQSAEQPIEQLSGGNQQKVLVARSLRHDLQVLLVDEPTRGIDVDAKRKLHQVLRGWVEQGHGVLMVSSDLSELLEHSDRIYVMVDGQTGPARLTSEFDEHSLLEAALGIVSSTSARQSCEEVQR